ncbi:MAG: RICIN domain-containing protein [Candidatus Pseudobacter hemicellulosilyticus]|uniref:RICIN domain-containing protein n=1 Tax=Candidatus Pseudobacter hemicellulosilyticus TaxID=3121375 RepID=A0AAJ5WWC2_9BACT|nr:MAG: RICIN domain-containing protein [Pseudobacter sp.]
MKRTALILLVSFFTAITAGAQITENSYAIRNAFTGQVLRIKDANKANGTPIVGHAPVNWKCVTWDFKQQKDGAYRLINLFSGKTMQPAKDGKSLEEQPLNADGKQQQYEFIKAGIDTYLIKLSGTEFYLTASEQDDKQILLAVKTGNILQQWTLKEQHPTM